MKTHKGFVIPLLLAIIAVLLIGGGAYVYKNTKIEPSSQAQQTAFTVSPTPSSGAKTLLGTSNIFTYESKPGDKVGDMILIKIGHPTMKAWQANPENVLAEFTGTVTVIGKLSASTGNLEDIGVGPQYSLNNLTPDSLKKLPYLQNDSRDVWFGVLNPDVMKNSLVKNGDIVEMIISKYVYVFFPSSVWNGADVVTVRKIQ